STSISVWRCRQHAGAGGRLRRLVWPLQGHCSQAGAVQQPVCQYQILQGQRRQSPRCGTGVGSVVHAQFLSLPSGRLCGEGGWRQPGAARDLHQETCRECPGV
ncbi:hypothetical protein ACP6JB_005950, partial [Aspergillus fumigatus]